MSSSGLLVGKNWSHWEVDAVLVVWHEKGNEMGIMMARYRAGGSPKWGLQWLFSTFTNIPKTMQSETGLQMSSRYPPMWPWANSLTPLCLSFLTCKMRQTLAPTPKDPLGLWWDNATFFNSVLVFKSCQAPLFRDCDSPGLREGPERAWRNAPHIPSTRPCTEYSPNKGIKKKRERGTNTWWWPAHLPGRSHHRENCASRGKSSQ